MTKDGEFIKAMYGLRPDTGRRVINFISVYSSTNPMRSYIEGDVPRGRNGVIAPVSKEKQKEMKELIHTMLVPSSELSWIRKDERQLNWIALRINGIFPIKQFGKIEQIDGRDKIIAQIDTCGMKKEIKIQNLKIMYDAWKNTLAEDKIMNRLKGEDEKSKCQLVTEWIKKKELYQPPRKILNSTADVISYFDEIQFTEAEKKNCIDSIMGTYNKKISRLKKPGEKQCCVNLPSDTLEKLNKMVKNEKSSQAEFIKNLIDGAWVLRFKRPDLFV